VFDPRLPLLLPLLLFCVPAFVGCAEKAAAPTRPALTTVPVTSAAEPPQDEAAGLSPQGRKAPPTGPVVPPAIRRAVLNKVLAKLKDPADFDETRLTARVEEVTGAKVATVRKGPFGLLQITFAEADPPRDAAAQKRLVDALLASGAFRFVEPERLLEAKGEH